MRNNNEDIFEFITNVMNKRHYMVREKVRDINAQISGLRLLAREKAGTYLAYWCNREANYLEKRLNESLSSGSHIHHTQ